MISPAVESTCVTAAALKSVIPNAFRLSAVEWQDDETRPQSSIVVKRGRAAVRCMRLVRRTVQRVSSPT